MHEQFNPRRRRVLKAGALGASSLFLGLGSSFAFASQPLRMILPLSVGSGGDNIARAASQALGDALDGRSIVVDNMPGAGGVIGTQAIIRAPADGNTVGVVSNNHVIFPSVVKDLGFDPVADITPIAIVCASPMLVVTRPDLPVSNLQELAALLKADPGKYNFGSSGNGTILHLAAEQFMQSSGTESTHIPYRGTGPLVTAVLAGQVDWAVIALPAIAGLAQSGGIKVIGTASAERLPALPNVQTGVEQGYPDYVVDGWVAVIGPKGMDPETVKTLNAAVRKAYSQPEVKEAMDRQGNRLILSTVEEARDYVASESEKYARLAKGAGLTPQ